MTDKTDELLSTFRPLGDSSRRLVEKIFRDRAKRKKLAGGAADRGLTAPDGEGGPGGTGSANHPPCGVHSREAGEAEAPPEVARGETVKPRGLA